MASSKATMLAVMGLVAALLPTATLSTAPSLISMPTDGDLHRSPPVVSFADDLTPNYYDGMCPNVEDIVHSAVVDALKMDITLAAGLIRLFYHDCFPQGCDASILLEGAGHDSELQMLPNRFLQRGAVELIETIRIKVHGKWVEGTSLHTSKLLIR